MQQITDETRKKVVCEHIRDGRTIASLAAEYGVSPATISNWGGARTAKNAKQMIPKKLSWS